MNEEQSYDLSHLEKQAIVGATLRERILMDELQKEFSLTLEAIEQRLGLEAGALSTTHVIDLQAGKVMKRQSPEGSEQQEAPAEIV